MILTRLRTWKLLVLTLILCPTFFYMIHSFINSRPDPKCGWPPPRPPDVSDKTPFDLTLCVRPQRHTRMNHQEPKYFLSDLFELPQMYSNQRVTFDDLAIVSDNV